MSILEQIEAEIAERYQMVVDPAHGWDHIQRVYRTARRLAEEEGADLLIVSLAALLHDLGHLLPGEGVHVTRSLEEASAIMERAGLDPEKIPQVLHAIEAHSFSHGVIPRTLEAQVVQDADRLDALGALGIARWGIVGGQRSAQIYDASDPWAEHRSLDDRRYMIDHFPAKLFSIATTLQTETARALGARRLKIMEQFLACFREELSELSSDS